MTVLVVASSDRRSHPALKKLDELQLSYPGYERDKRDAEAVLWGKSRLNLGFDAALRRLKVKQRAHEEQKNLTRSSFNRTHPNLVSLDALKLSYPGWERDVQLAEAAHNKNPKCEFFEIIRKLQVKQFRFENDRSHYRLKALDSLKLSYPGWKNDIRNLEKFHFEEAFFLAGDSIFQGKIDGLKRRQQIFLKSQLSRGNRQQLMLENEGEEEEEVAPTDVKSNSYDDRKEENATFLLPALQHSKSPVKRSDARYSASCTNGNPVESAEDRTDRQTVRAPCPASDTGDDEERIKDIISLMSPTPKSVSPRPDPPENGLRHTRNIRRQGSIDCDEQRSGTNEKTTNEKTPADATQSRDPIEQKPKLAPPPPPKSRPNRLSAYVNLNPPRTIPEESEEEGSEEDQLTELPTIPSALPASGMSICSAPVMRGRYAGASSSSGRRPRYSGRSESSSNYSARTTAGRYSAPPLMPSYNKDDEQSLSSSRAINGSNHHRTLPSIMSLATPSGNWTVQDGGDDLSAASHTSSQAVLAEDETSVVSASSSRAIWAESPTPYSAPSPFSSVRVVAPPSPESRYSSNRIVSTRHIKEKSRQRSSSSRYYDEQSSCSRMSQASSTRSKSLGQCTICGDAAKNHVFVPCGHLCACKECARQVISRKMACPVCRGNVTDAIQVFL